MKHILIVNRFSNSHKKFPNNLYFVVVVVVCLLFATASHSQCMEAGPLQHKNTIIHKCKHIHLPEYSMIAKHSLKGAVSCDLSYQSDIKGKPQHNWGISKYPSVPKEPYHFSAILCLCIQWLLIHPPPSCLTLALSLSLSLLLLLLLCFFFIIYFFGSGDVENMHISGISSIFQTTILRGKKWISTFSCWHKAALQTSLKCMNSLHINKCTRTIVSQKLHFV